MTSDFSSFGLETQIITNLIELEHNNPTPIQEAIIPPMLEGQDVIGQAQTGTGKTAAFALPILNKLDTGRKQVQALILAPTRELAMQVASSIHQYGRKTKADVLAVYGGQSYTLQINRIKKGANIIVGTPGRLIDLINQGYLDISQVNTVVLDEADEMLSMGFQEDIESILSRTPSQRQTALLSATLPKGIRSLAEKYLTNPQSVCIGHKNQAASAVSQSYYLVNEKDKVAALTRLFETEEISSALIFARTRAGTAELAAELSSRGFNAEGLSGDLSQDARERILRRFKKEQIEVLVATDVAARGLDIDGISHVFNFDLPLDPEVYVHRIGRTGRAGKTGSAISLVSPKERWTLRKIENYSKQRIECAKLPSVQDIFDKREQALLDKMDMWLKRGRCNKEKELIAQMQEQGYELLDIAAVSLKLARAEEKQRPVAEISEVNENKRPVRAIGNKRGRRSSHTESGMIRLSLDTGKASGIEVRHVLGTLSHYANIPGKVIGKIRIHDQQTYVDVPEQFVGQVIDQKKALRIGRQVINVSVA